MVEVVTVWSSCVTRKRPFPAHSVCVASLSGRQTSRRRRPQEAEQALFFLHTAGSAHACRDGNHSSSDLTSSRQSSPSVLRPRICTGSATSSGPQRSSVAMQYSLQGVGYFSALWLRNDPRDPKKESRKRTEHARREALEESSALCQRYQRSDSRESRARWELSTEHPPRPNQQM